MTDAARTVEVHLTNSTNVDPSVRSAVADGNNSVWIAGEQPDSGQVVKQWDSVVWGVFTPAAADAASATVSLAGEGNSAIDISLTNPPNGTSAVTASSNDEIQATVTQLDGVDDHAVWQVVLSLRR